MPFPVTPALFVHLVAIAVAGAFAFWFLLSTLNQFNGMSQAVRRIDGLHVVPRWTFFAPNPGTSDYHLLYRPLDEDRKPGAWVEHELATRTLASILWNPHKRLRKGVFDMQQALMSLSRKHEIDVLQLTVPYLALLNVSSLELAKASPQAAYHQFAIAETKGPDGNCDCRLLFRSSPHQAN